MPPLSAELWHGWRRSNSWSPTRGDRGNPPAHAWKLRSSTPKRSKVLGAQKRQKRTPNTKKSYIYIYIYKQCFLPNPYYLSSLIFLHKKPILKIHVMGVSSSSPRHRWLFSLSVLENVFQGLSLVLVSKRKLTQALLTKKKSHLFHLPPKWFSGYHYASTVASPPKKNCWL